MKINLQGSTFGRKVIAGVTSVAFITAAVGVSVAIAAITFSNTSMTGDSSFISLLIGATGGIDSTASSTVLIGNQNATTITVGRTGQSVSFPGNVTITGTRAIGGGTAIITEVCATSSKTFAALGTTATTSFDFAISGATSSLNQVFSATIEASSAANMVVTAATTSTTGWARVSVSNPGSAFTLAPSSTVAVCYKQF